MIWRRINLVRRPRSDKRLTFGLSFQSGHLVCFSESSIEGSLFGKGAKRTPAEEASREPCLARERKKRNRIARKEEEGERKSLRVRESNVGQDLNQRGMIILALEQQYSIILSALRLVACEDFYAQLWCFPCRVGMLEQVAPNWPGFLSSSFLILRFPSLPLISFPTSSYSCSRFHRANKRARQANLAATLVSKRATFAPSKASARTTLGPLWSLVQQRASRSRGETRQEATGAIDSNYFQPAALAGSGQTATRASHVNAAQPTFTCPPICLSTRFSSLLSSSSSSSSTFSSLSRSRSRKPLRSAKPESVQDAA